MPDTPDRAALAERLAAWAAKDGPAFVAMLSDVRRDLRAAAAALAAPAVPQSVAEARDSLAGALCEARYLAFPAGPHHDVQTCEGCRAHVDTLIAAVRAATVACDECGAGASYTPATDPPPARRWKDVWFSRALDEAVRVVEGVRWSHPSVSDFEDGRNAAISDAVAALRAVREPS